MHGLTMISIWFEYGFSMALCSVVLSALCSVLCAPCSVLYAPCSVLSAQCFVVRALWSTLDEQHKAADLKPPESNQETDKTASVTEQDPLDSADSAGYGDDDVDVGDWDRSPESESDFAGVWQGTANPPDQNLTTLSGFHATAEAVVVAQGVAQASSDCSNVRRTKPRCQPPPLLQPPPGLTAVEEC